MEKKIKKIKKWVIESIEYTDGSVTMNRTCEGFSPIELLGQLSLIKSEVIDQIKGKYKPEIVTRKYIKDELKP